MTKISFEKFSIEKKESNCMTLPRKIEIEILQDQKYTNKISNIKFFEQKEFEFIKFLLNRLVENNESCDSNSVNTNGDHFMETVLTLNEKDDYLLDMLFHISNDLGLTYRHLNMKDMSSNKFFGEKLDLSIKTLSRVLVIDCFQEFESLIKLIHENNYSID